MNPPPKQPLSPAKADAPARISSGSLLGPRREVIIVHAGREYRLRLTQYGRLILTA
jgi:hemin uptake protein HemP